MTEIIVNQFQSLLKKKYFLVGNNGLEGRIDLFVYKKSHKITPLFEEKSTLSLQSLRAAIGQLFLYSNNIVLKPVLVIICRKNVDHFVLLPIPERHLSVAKFT